MLSVSTCSGEQWCRKARCEDHLLHVIEGRSHGNNHPLGIRLVVEVAGDRFPFGNLLPVFLSRAKVITGDGVEVEFHIFHTPFCGETVKQNYTKEEITFKLRSRLILNVYALTVPRVLTGPKPRLSLHELACPDT